MMWKRIAVVFGALAILATTGYVASAAVTDGGGKKAAISPAAGPVGSALVNPSPRSTAEYWTAARLKAAKPMERVRGGTSPQAHGTSNLDFTRSRITPQSANTAAPYKGAGKLFFTIPGPAPVGGNYQCSASIIGNRLIVTAGHCMYGTDGNGRAGYYTNWRFIPAYDGTALTLAGQRPYGLWNWAAAVVPGKYRTSSSTVVNNYDFGIIQLADQSFNAGPLTTVFGKVGFKFNTAVGHLFDTAVTSLGYPGNLDNGLIMQRVDSSDHRGSGVSAPNNGSTAFEYGSDMGGGSSGGPWVENLGNPASASPTGGFNIRNSVIGVTSYGYIDPNVRAQGASQFNSDFTAIKTTMCGLKLGNC
jgi:V8-like Glu-specific endopeptidase